MNRRPIRFLHRGHVVEVAEVAEVPPRRTLLQWLSEEPEVIALAVVAQLLQCSAPPVPGIVAPHYAPRPERA